MKSFINKSFWKLLKDYWWRQWKYFHQGQEKVGFFKNYFSLYIFEMGVFSFLILQMSLDKGNPRDRGAWLATIHGVTRVRHDLETKPPPPPFVWKGYSAVMSQWINQRLGSRLASYSDQNSEKAMATHSSTLAWKIPGMAEPGALLSLGSHKVGHDWSDLAAAAADQNYM